MNLVWILLGFIIDSMGWLSVDSVNWTQAGFDSVDLESLNRRFNRYFVFKFFSLEPLVSMGNYIFFL